MKLVIISKIAGINVNEVMNTSVCTGSDQLCPPPGSGWLVIPGSCAEGEGRNQPEKDRGDRQRHQDLPLRLSKFFMTD
ncbi:hypothetical protein ACLB1S_18150 [Escherichia coli]